MMLDAIALKASLTEAVPSTMDIKPCSNEELTVSCTVFRRFMAGLSSSSTATAATLAEEPTPAVDDERPSNIFLYAAAAASCRSNSFVASDFIEPPAPADRPPFKSLLV